MLLESALQKEVSITKTEIIIENVVVTARINQDLNIKKIIKKFSDVKYDSKKFPGAVIKLKSPRATIILFRTGSIVCTGTKSEDGARYALSFFTNKLEEFGINIVHGLSNVKVENIVSSCNLRNKIHLEQAAKILPRSMYEPEQFPGIIHRVLYPKTVILLFASGKLVCTGAKKAKDIHIAVNHFQHMLSEKNLILNSEFTKK